MRLGRSTRVRRLGRRAAFRRGDAVPRELRHATTDPLDLSRFLRNIVQSEAGLTFSALFAGRTPLLRAALEGQVYAQFDRAPREHWEVMRAGMPNLFMVMDKLGCNPFTERFAIDFVLEGTVRGTGGLQVVGDDCASAALGLFLAGDVASREAIVGGATGAGAPNAAWAPCWRWRAGPTPARWRAPRAAPCTRGSTSPTSTRSSSTVSRAAGSIRCGHESIRSSPRSAQTGWRRDRAPAQVRATLRRALEHVPVQHLCASSNCGLALLPRDVARRKLEALVAGTAQLRRELGG